MHLYSYSKNEFLVGQICYLSFKSLAIVLCVFISCFSIQFFCLEKKKRIGLGWIATLLWKTKTILSPPMPIFYFHSEKNCASQFCTTVTVGGKVCTRLFQNLWSTGTKKHFLRQTHLCVHTFQNMQWVATIPFRVKHVRTDAVNKTKDVNQLF